MPTSCRRPSAPPSIPCRGPCSPPWRGTNLPVAVRVAVKRQSPHSLQLGEWGDFVAIASNSLGGEGGIRTPEGVCQLIYSQPPLAAWVPHRVCAVARWHDSE